MKVMTGNTIKYLLRQTAALGVLPAYINRVAGIVVKSYKGHVTVVPSPSFNDYRNVLSNVSPEQYHGAFQSMYV